MSGLLSILLLLAPLSGTGSEPTVVSGTLAGSDGRPIPVSHVHVHAWPGGEILASARVRPDGSWSLALDTAGVFLAWFSGLGHAGERTGLLVDGGQPRIEIDVVLARHALRDGFEEPSLIGDFNDFASDRGVVPMRPRDDGAWVTEIATESDSLAYQILGVAWSGPVADPAAARFSYDGSGGYRSVVTTGGSFATIILDARGLVAGSGAGEVRFRDPASPAGRFGAFTRDLFAYVDAYFDRRARAAATGTTVAGMRAIYEEYDPRAAGGFVQEALAGEPNAELRDLMLVAYLAAPIKTDPEVASAGLDQIPPSSSAWLLQPSGLPKGLEAVPDRDRARAFALSVLRSSTPAAGADSLRPGILSWLLEDALARGAAGEVEAYHAWLAGEYPDSKAAEKAAALYAPERRIRPGQQIPRFEVRSMDDPALTISTADLAGRVVMMDFWATWCGPCITEMPFMHEAFERYAPDGFTILSLSFDLERADVERFRAEGDWPMPWWHVFVEQGAESELAHRLDVVNIPRAILVGRDGTILATNESLRGERLDETLSRVFGRED